MSSTRSEPLLGGDAATAAGALARVVDTVREMSRQNDPNEMAQAYAARMRQLMPTDRNISLSRRELEFPQYRITRSDLYTQPIDPWKQRKNLPVLQGGLLADLLYADEPRIIDDLRLDPADPAREHLDGFRSLLAIPHYDQGIGLNMVIHLRRESGAFDHAHLPQLVLMSNLFGRATHSLVLARELGSVNEHLREQYSEVSQLSDTILDQALKLKRHTSVLEDKVQERTAQLHEANLDALYMLAVASEAKDEDTGEHVRRIQTYSKLLAREMGAGPHEAEDIGYAAILHDVGKMHVPDQILKKPGPLTTDERKVMERHTELGQHILRDTPFFSLARQVARSHHENWDGSGYPDGLRGEETPTAVRIVHLADVFDALVSPRVYKPAWRVKDAVAEIERLERKMFDPAVVEAFRRLVKDGALPTHRKSSPAADEPPTPVEPSVA